MQNKIKIPHGKPGLMGKQKIYIYMCAHMCVQYMCESVFNIERHSFTPAPLEGRGNIFRDESQLSLIGEEVLPTNIACHS